MAKSVKQRLDTLELERAGLTGCRVFYADDYAPDELAALLESARREVQNVIIVTYADEPAEATE